MERKNACCCCNGAAAAATEESVEKAMEAGRWSAVVPVAADLL